MEGQPTSKLAPLATQVVDFVAKHEQGVKASDVVKEFSVRGVKKSDTTDALTFALSEGTLTLGDNLRFVKNNHLAAA